MKPFSDFLCHMVSMQMCRFNWNVRAFFASFLLNGAPPARAAYTSAMALSTHLGCSTEDKHLKSSRCWDRISASAGVIIKGVDTVGGGTTAGRSDWLPDVSEVGSLCMSDRRGCYVSAIVQRQGLEDNICLPFIYYSVSCVYIIYWEPPFMWGVRAGILIAHSDHTSDMRELPHFCHCGHCPM